jgi:hypothetical protein
MIMVRRDIQVEGFENTDYFLAYFPEALPSSEFGFFLNDYLLIPLKKKFFTTFIGSPFILGIEAFFEVVFEDGTRQSRPFAYKEKHTSIDPERCRWNGNTIPEEYRPQNRQKEEEVLLQIINDLKVKGYHAHEDHLSLFFNRKIDKLLLESNDGGKSQETLRATG